MEQPAPFSATSVLSFSWRPDITPAGPFPETEVTVPVMAPSAARMPLIILTPLMSLKYATPLIGVAPAGGRRAICHSMEGQLAVMAVEWPIMAPEPEIRLGEDFRRSRKAERSSRERGNSHRGYGVSHVSPFRELQASYRTSLIG